MKPLERILVVGAGIAGLALARALRQQELSAEIVEQRREWEVVGAGMYLPANGGRALRALGLFDAVRERARLIKWQRFLNRQGQTLVDLDMHSLWGDVGPCLAISRPALHEVLLVGAGDVPVRMGTTITALSQDDDAVAVDFTDGSSGRYDLVVGTDGIPSAVRRMAFGDTSPAYVGQVSWRCIVPAADAVEHWTVLLGGSRTFLMLPLPDGKVYCYGDLSAPHRPGTLDGNRLDRFRALFRDFAAPVPQLVAQITDPAQIYPAAIEEVVQEPWVHGRVVLIGDSAHAMSPNMAEGACLALEDAAVLARLLGEYRSVEASLSAFVAQRRPRVSWVRQQTHRRDRMRRLPSLLRDLALRTTGTRIVRANYAPLLAEA